ncbi:hypothetical protein EMIHUDRAFT_112355 [Emiliania huxleyi CCMP1516]|uniref:PCIF1 WW domain-containing protein n=2 Tax=Emiliania huxleyi TaxID=2903 RepID=A0A0D3K9S3_EMIH1|nr:hypothetical protein EMIHUDRAFT_112355 [Emiliania huxleyi CCMP1516]EOD32508.1 hypothetical protein EMIHUDRAFT_112355 [Emiliania huxleyi CCMP1516]|eukprot:XP_005784937.1 hypothetical protein EMIHUDRAFT_112355 [Emiliania huxleyi CCMP1516]
MRPIVPFVRPRASQKEQASPGAQKAKSAPGGGGKRRAKCKPSASKKARTAAASVPKQRAPVSRQTPEEVEAAEVRCFDPMVGPSGLWPQSRPLAASPPPLALEIARGEGLRQLRLRCADLVRGLPTGAGALVGAFERWHFGWLLHASRAGGAGDPLLPGGAAGAPEPDAELRAELEAAGCEPAAAAAVAADLRRAAAEAATAAAARAAAASAEGGGEGGSGGEEDGVGLREAEVGGGVWCVSLPPALLAPLPQELRKPLKISDEWLSKLREMHTATVASTAPASAPASASAASAAAAELRFRSDLARLLLRYKALGGSGFQAAIGGGAFAVLRASFGARLECFASPLNARSAPFCSAFPDVDAPFGSLGSFLEFEPEEGAYEANPPFVPLVLRAMCAHMHRLLDRAEASRRPLLFVVVVGASSALKRHAAWEDLQGLAAGRHGRAQWLLPLHAHGYTEGHAHIAKGGARAARRMSSCDTAVFVWASSAGAEQWPVTDGAEAALRAAMKAAIPRTLRKATKANRHAHAAKKQARNHSSR